MKVDKVSLRSLALKLVGRGFSVLSGTVPALCSGKYVTVFSITGPLGHCDSSHECLCVLEVAEACD